MAQDDLKTDRGRSWVVAACCCFTNLMFYGVSRLSGIMLVNATHTFQVSRASAAVPFSLSTAIRNLAGVFVGHLGHRFGVGVVVATGCLIASLGSGLCYFAQSVQWLTVCWGVIFGFGFGLSTCLLPLAINQNFVKHNGTASGISYSGAYLGSFIFPPIIVWLMDSFGFQGTFLIISGGILNVLVVAMILREPNSCKKRAISGSLRNPSCSESYSDHKVVSIIGENAEFCEMGKYNINKAYLDSQGNTRDQTNKPCFQTNSYSIYLLQDSDPACCKNFSAREKFSRCNINNSTTHSDINIHHTKLCNLFKDFKFESIFSSSKEAEKTPTEITSSSMYLSSSAKDNDSFQTTKCSNAPSSTNVNVASIGDAAKEVPIIPKVYFRKLFDCRLFSKGKYKAKCKLKLQKLKKVIEISLIKTRTPLYEIVQNDNVKLTSFKRLHPILYPISFSESAPNEYLSTPHSVSRGQSVVGENDQSIGHRNYITAIQQYSSTKEPLYFTGMPGHQKNANVGPDLNNILNGNENPLLIHGQNETANNSVKELNYCQLLSVTNDDDDDTCSKKSSLHDDASSTCKMENSQSSFEVPSSSSELSLQNTSTGRKDSSSGNHTKSSAARRCFSDWLHMMREPMLALIGLTMSIQTFIVASIVTTIEDYAKDIGISEHRTHYALMALSVSNLTGTLTLGTITDRGLISRHRFLSLCFLGMSLSLVALSLFAVSLTSLLSLVIIYGLLESGVIITFPILTKQFVKGERRQAVAIASSNVLSAPTVMLVPMLIGYFRDNIGCYSGLFQLLGGTSFICSLLWLVTPSVCKKIRLKKKGILNLNI